MLIPKHIKLVIPVEITRYAYHNGLSKAFALYLYLKMHSDGIVHEKSDIFKGLLSSLKIKERRTLRKYIDLLKKHNWIGYDAKTGKYYVRSFDAIRAQQQFYNRQATVFFANYIHSVPAYIIAVILGSKLKSNKFFWEVVNEGKLRTATKNKDVAFQPKAPSKLSKPIYNGLCKWKIAELFNCSLTAATELKQQAATAGFISVTHQFSDYLKIKNADFKLRPILNDLAPSLSKRLRFKYSPKTDNPNIPKLVTILTQSYDKIECMLEFKTVNKFKKLKVSDTVKIGIAKISHLTSKAA